MYQDLKDVHVRSGAPYRCSAFPAYASLGGYPVLYITDDSAVLCASCLNENLPEICDGWAGDGWHVVAVDINWEESECYCDHCAKQIEAAYA